MKNNSTTACVLQKSNLAAPVYRTFFCGEKTLNLWVVHKIVHALHECTVVSKKRVTWIYYDWSTIEKTTSRSLKNRLSSFLLSLGCSAFYEILPTSQTQNTTPWAQIRLDEGNDSQIDERIEGLFRLFRKLKKRRHRCVILGGYYFEGDQIDLEDKIKILLYLF